MALDIFILNIKMEDMIKNTPNHEYYELSPAEQVRYHNLMAEKSMLTRRLTAYVRNDRDV